MINSAKYIDEIIEKLSLLRQEISTRVGLGLTDLNKHCENFFGNILNIIYDYKLVNLNDSVENFSGIDLGDKEKKISYQVTSTAKSDKVDHTLSMFLRYKHYETFNSVKILILTKRQISYTLKVDTQGKFSFATDKDILDIDDLYRYIRSLPIDKLEKLVAYIRKEITPARMSIAKDGVLPEQKDLLVHYCAWISKTSETFNVPGLNVSLPISHSWIQLRALDRSDNKDRQEKNDIRKAIQAYHEWERLANSSNDGKVINAKHITTFDKRVIIVGGPGSGKSTLIKRLTNTYALQNKIILRVRLQRVAIQVWKQGHNFEEALIKETSDGSGLPPSEIGQILRQPHFLFADGLDECDPYRIQMCEAINAWANGHKDSVIVITSRPVGHNPEYFVGWNHYELLPLSKTDAIDFGRKVIEKYFNGNLQKVDSELKRFDELLESNRVASLASRNPLLLGFLVSLSLNYKEIGKRRAVLYGQVIRQIQDTPLTDRVSGIDISSSLATRLSEIFGWLIQIDSGISSAELINQSAYILSRETEKPLLTCKEYAEMALRFWEERRVLERLTLGNTDAITFTHLSLCEYAAAKYIANLEESEINRWITEVRNLPKWRETILLAAGVGACNTIIKTLLTLTRQNDPTSMELLLAASAQVEAENVNDNLIKAVAQGLVDRLTSSIPLIVYESGAAALDLVQYAPDVIVPVVKNLLNHDQEWTCTTAWALLLKAGREYIDLDLLESSFSKLINTNISSAHFE